MSNFHRAGTWDTHARCGSPSLTLAKRALPHASAPERVGHTRRGHRDDRASFSRALRSGRSRSAPSSRLWSFSGLRGPTSSYCRPLGSLIPAPRQTWERNVPETRKCKRDKHGAIGAAEVHRARLGRNRPIGPHGLGHPSHFVVLERQLMQCLRILVFHELLEEVLVALMALGTLSFHVFQGRCFDRLARATLRQMAVQRGAYARARRNRRPMRAYECCRLP